MIMSLSLAATIEWTSCSKESLSSQTALNSTPTPSISLLVASQLLLEVLPFATTCARRRWASSLVAWSSVGPTDGGCVVLGSVGERLDSRSNQTRTDLDVDLPVLGDALVVFVHVKLGAENHVQLLLQKRDPRARILSVPRLRADMTVPVGLHILRCRPSP